ncbi:AMP-dependent synthetase/ligase [Luteimicrobium xylanilyticum]|uniref:Acyl-CoA synthetase n=1 Tax=Luteimicrobium xylanilyticum TaxID=1133546 RepID=A0A5P9QAU1_9MICO|nr:long-chain fatty acid--CoA ligase [Luteimicrobium xylanilyticum]QFU98571.1 Long-chain-fatty-acid--CoA ligase [Luteimicrobium xylanilyticum]
MPESSTPRLVEVDPTSNLNAFLAQRVAQRPDGALFEERDGEGGWRPVTARDFDARVVRVAKGLVARGLEPGDHVGIMAHTSLEWSVLDWACWAASLVPVPLYETSSAEQVRWSCEDSHVRLLVVEDDAMAAAVAAFRSEVPVLDDVLALSQDALGVLEAEGAKVDDAEIARRRALATLDDVATVIYTSGTTGNPKGVELTHGNFVDLCANAIAKMHEVLAGNSRTLLFMPMAHVFARFIAVVVVPAGAVLAHASSTTTLLDDLASFRPTFLLAVPRVFEKVYNSSEQKAAEQGRATRAVFHWAVASGIRWSRALDSRRGPGPVLRARHRLADALVLRRLRTALGGDTRWAISGGAPLGERLGHFFRSVGVTVLEGYGLTETTAPVTVNVPGHVVIGTVGPPLPGSAVRIADDGEVLVRGPGVFRGYHGNDAATRDAFDDGWFRTGDLGALDGDGMLTITGRKKEIIVTAGGKNVAPAVLEDRVRAHPLVSQCVVVGDARPFVGALITLDAEALPGWLAVHGKPELTIEQAAADPDVLAALQQAVDRANQAVSRAESIRKFRVLGTDFTVENGYLSNKLGVKRFLVLKDFAGEIDALYADAGKHGF